jgi:hypothetical protein
MTRRVLVPVGWINSSPNQAENIARILWLSSYISKSVASQITGRIVSWQYRCFLPSKQFCSEREATLKTSNS